MQCSTSLQITNLKFVQLQNIVLSYEGVLRIIKDLHACSRSTHQFAFAVTTVRFGSSHTGTHRPEKRWTVPHRMLRQANAL